MVARLREFLRVFDDNLKSLVLFGAVVAPVLAGGIQGVQQSGGWRALLRDKNIPLA
jgi:hypothetical protein